MTEQSKYIHEVSAFTVVEAGRVFTVTCRRVNKYKEPEIWQVIIAEPFGDVSVYESTNARDIQEEAHAEIRKKRHARPFMLQHTLGPKKYTQRNTTGAAVLQSRAA